MNKQPTKFRFQAWDKEDKRFIVHEQEFIPLMVTSRGVFRLDHATEEDRWIFFEDRAIIMQSSGLKDKNDKELFYDSSVVKIDLDPSGRLWYAVKDDFDIPCFLPIDGAFGVMLTFQEVFLGSLTAKRKGFEIVGTLQENPELLEANSAVQT